MCVCVRALVNNGKTIYVYTLSHYIYIYLLHVTKYLHTYMFIYICIICLSQLFVNFMSIWHYQYMYIQYAVSCKYFVRRRHEKIATIGNFPCFQIEHVILSSQCAFKHIH